MSAFKYAIGRPFTPDLATAPVTSGTEGDFVIVTGASSSDSATGYSPYDVVHEHLDRGWRSTTGAGNKTLTLTTASVQPDAILIEGLTVSAILISGGVSLKAVSQNVRNGRRQIVVVPTSATGTWTFTSSSSYHVSPYDYFGIGRISFIKNGALTTMTTNWGEPYNWSVNSQGGERTFAGGYVESTNTSQNFINFQLQGLFDQSIAASYADPFRYCRMARDERVFHWEDRDDDSDKTLGFMCRRAGEGVIVQQYPYFDVDVPISEVI